MTDHFPQAAEQMSQTESEGIRRATKAYQLLLRVSASLIPLAAILYVAVYQDPALKFRSHGFHEIAIAIAILLSGFATYVTCLCYRSSGEVFLRWLTLGLGGFTILYAPHGALTRMSHDNIVLFVIFGPVSRLAMVSCFLIALLRYGAPAVPPARRNLPQFWLGGLAIFTMAGVAATAGAIAAPTVTRRFMPVLESAALSISLIALLVLASLRLRSPLMTVYTIAMAAFAQSSISFLAAAPWNPSVVARARDLRRGLFRHELGHRAGLSHHAVVQARLQPGKVDGGAPCGEGPRRQGARRVPAHRCGALSLRA